LYICLLLQHDGVFLEWLPISESGKVDKVDSKGDTDWMMVNAETGSVAYKTERQTATEGNYFYFTICKHVSVCFIIVIFFILTSA